MRRVSIARQSSIPTCAMRPGSVPVRGCHTSGLYGGWVIVAYAILQADWLAGWLAHLRAGSLAEWDRLADAVVAAPGGTMQTRCVPDPCPVGQPRLDRSSLDHSFVNIPIGTCPAGITQLASQKSSQESSRKVICRTLSRTSPLPRGGSTSNPTILVIQRPVDHGAIAWYQVVQRRRRTGGVV